MKNLSSGPECDYSFDMLYFAAFGKKIPKKDKIKFQNLSQEKINNLVAEWAQKAGWKTEKKLGENNAVFLAFYP